MVHSESGSTTLQSALECIMLGLEKELVSELR